MIEFTKQELADRRATRRERIAALGRGHARVKLLRDLLRLVSRLAAEHVIDHPADECPCRFCTDSEASVANISADVATVGGMARMAADTLDMTVEDEIDRRPNADPAAELRRLAREVDRV